MLDLSKIILCTVEIYKIRKFKFQCDIASFTTFNIKKNNCLDCLCDSIEYFLRNIESLCLHFLIIECAVLPILYFATNINLYLPFSSISIYNRLELKIWNVYLKISIILKLHLGIFKIKIKNHVRLLYKQFICFIGSNMKIACSLDCGMENANLIWGPSWNLFLRNDNQWR